jgi:hypothetical protein
MDRKPSGSRVLKLIVALLTGAVVAGCGDMSLPGWTPQTLRPAAQPAPEADPGISPLPVAGARTPEALDRSTRVERAQAVSVSDRGRPLGTTIATLGSPTEPGFWLKTPLVTTEQPGVVRSQQTAKRVAVTLVPIAGPATAGSRISLAAMRALELPLTALAELDVSQAR